MVMGVKLEFLRRLCFQNFSFGNERLVVEGETTIACGYLGLVKFDIFSLTFPDKHKNACKFCAVALDKFYTLQVCMVILIFMSSI